MLNAQRWSVSSVIVACNRPEIMLLLSSRFFIVSFFFLFSFFIQITTSVLTVRVRTVERVSTHLVATDANVTMDTVVKTAI